MENILYYPDFRDSTSGIVFFRGISGRKFNALSADFPESACSADLPP